MPDDTTLAISADDPESDILAGMHDIETAIAQITHIDEALDFRDMMHEALFLMKRRKLASEVLNRAARAVVALHVSLGGFLHEREHHKGGRPNENSSPEGSSYREVMTLTEMGVTYNESATYQNLAKVPALTLEMWMDEVEAYNQFVYPSVVGNWATQYVHKKGQGTTTVVGADGVTRERCAACGGGGWVDEDKQPLIVVEGTGLDIQYTEEFRRLMLDHKGPRKLRVMVWDVE